MFQKAKQAIMKMAMKKQLASVPADQRALLENLIDNHPDLMMKIAQELQAEMKKNGNNQQLAMQAIAMRHREELQKIVGNKKMR